MYSLTIHFGPNAMVWQFLFKEKKAAEDASLDQISPITLTIRDDFGQHASIDRAQIHGILLEDLDQVERARIERSLAEERCKVKLMTAAKSDPVIAAAIRAQQNGPGVLTPFRQ